MTYLDTKEAAKIAHVSAWTVRKWVREGLLKASKPGGRCMLIAESDLQDLVRRTVVGGTK